MAMSASDGETVLAATQATLSQHLGEGHDLRVLEVSIGDLSVVRWQRLMDPTHA